MSIDLGQMVCNMGECIRILLDVLLCSLFKSVCVKRDPFVECCELAGIIVSRAALHDET